tara:strand:- start:137 stop:322 length:186 start_codon:yes stop_codon:yes gene_type:complete
MEVKNEQYQRLRNKKSEGGGLFRHHIFNEETKEIWVLCESSITTMVLGAMIKRNYSNKWIL